MNVFIKEDEGATIDCTSWLRLKIICNAKVGGNVGCITKAEVGTYWIAEVEIWIDWTAGCSVTIGEGGMDKSVDRESSFAIILRSCAPNQ